MPDMLAKLYELPDAEPAEQRCAAAGIAIRRLEAWDRAALRAFVREHFNEDWAVEADFAFTGGHPIRGFVAVMDGAICGFAVYECTRRNFFGPTGVRPDVRGRGAGEALLLRCLASMREMGYGYAVIGWVGPERFYERACGARMIEGSETSVYAALRAERSAREARIAADRS